MAPQILSAFPQWQTIRLAWSRLIHPRPVLLSISDSHLVFCWRGRGGWLFRSASLSAGACCNGLPQQKEALAELIADLVFDLGLAGAELVLCLPPALAHWCVVDGLKEEHWDSNGSCRYSLVSADLPFKLQESYVLSQALQDGVAVAGIARSALLAWIDVVEIADLPLRRVSWSLLDAHRTLTQITEDWLGPLAWLLVHDGKARLVLMQDRTPELDHPLTSTDPDVAVAEVRACVQAWQQTHHSVSPLGWWFTANDANHSDWHQIVDFEAGEMVLNHQLRWSPDPWSDSDEALVLPPLAHLALMTLHGEESW